MDTDRWVSYYWQIYYCYKLSPQRVLEIGPGNNIVKNVVGKEIAWITMDFDREIDPDILAVLEKVPLKTNSMDLILCAEVLEHIPFSKFESTLLELERVTKRWVLLSLPYARRTFQCIVRLPEYSVLRSFKSINIDVPRCSKQARKHRFPGISFTINISKFNKKHVFDKRIQHYWEIGKKGYPFQLIANSLSKYFSVEETFYPIENPHHQFFLLKKKSLQS